MKIRALLALMAMLLSGAEAHAQFPGHKLGEQLLLEDVAEPPYGAADAFMVSRGGIINQVPGDRLISASGSPVTDNIAAWSVGVGRAIKDSGIKATSGRLVVPAGSDIGSTADTRLWVKHDAIDPATAARYGVLGAVTYKPTSGSPWSSTIEGVIGLSYMQGAGTFSGYAFGVGGTAIVCDPNAAPVCPAGTVANSTSIQAGIYGSAEMNGAGTAAWLAGLWGDGANTIVLSGTATNVAAAYLTRPTGGINNYGVYLANGAAPANGSLASAGDITIVPGAVNAVVFQNAGATCGGESFSTNSGTFFSAMSGTNCGVTITPTGTGLVNLGSTTTGSVGLRYPASNVAVAANCTPNRLVPLTVNGVTLNVLAMTGTC
jgi:hypothetical protein